MHSQTIILTYFENLLLFVFVQRIFKFSNKYAIFTLNAIIYAAARVLVTIYSCTRVGHYIQLSHRRQVENAEPEQAEQQWEGQYGALMSFATYSITDTVHQQTCVSR